MSCIRHSVIRAIAFAILVSPSFGDVVTLKDGTKVEGKITKETDQQVTVEIKVSAGVFDERFIRRADVDHIDKVTPEMEAYKAITNIQPGTNSGTPSQYEPSIRALQNYLKLYPNGGHTAEVQASIDEFLAEKKRVEAGEVKLHGEWISKAQAEKERVQIDGLLALEYMKSQSAAGDNIGALNTFVTIEKSYGGSSSMPEAVELARQLIAATKPAVDRAIPDQKLFKAQKEQGFKDAGAAERIEMMAAYKADMTQAETVAAAADKAGQWPPFIPTNEKALSILLARIGRESTRLAVLNTDSMRKSLELTNAAKQSLTAREFDAATKTLLQATTLWSANELAKRMAADVVAEKAGLGKPAAAPVPVTPVPETPKPHLAGTPKPAVATGTPPKADPGKPSPATPASATPGAQTTPATPRPSDALRAATATPAPAAADDDTPFYMTIPGAIGIVVGIALVLVGLNIFKKMKAKKSAAEEIR